MDINRDNYEAWLLDLCEGRLSPEQERALRRFLAENPACDDSGLDSIGIRLKRPQVSFEQKDLLERKFPAPGESLQRGDFPMACIAAMEGDLDRSQEDGLEQMLEEDPQLQQEWEAWRMTRLPVRNIAYPGKRKLLKRGKAIRPVFWVSGAAAALILFLLLVGRLSPEQPDMPSPSLAEKVESGKDTPQGLERSPGEGKPAGDPAQNLNEREPGIITGNSRMIADNSQRIADNSQRIAAIPHSLVETLAAAGQEEIPPVKGVIITPASIRSDRLALLPELTAEHGSYDRIDEMQLALLALENGDPGAADWQDSGLRSGYRKFLEENDINLVRVASAGIEGLNTLTGSDMALNVERNDQGQVRRFRFQSPFFSVQAPVKKTK